MCNKNRVLSFFGFIVFVICSFLFINSHTYATTGINSQISFEGKIVNSSGVNITNGTYNMEFKIYSGGSNTGGGTLNWTEDELVSASQGVTFNGGTFQVNLGAVNTALLSSVNWNSNPLYLSIQIGSTSSCTPAGNFTANCGGDGEMSPYILLTSTPYAMNADNANNLGGTAAASYTQLATNNTFTGTNLFNPATNATNAVAIQNVAGTNILNVDNSTNTGTGNLVADGDFETSLPGAWTYNGTPGSIAIDSTTSYQGASSLKIISNNGTATNGIADSAKVLIPTTLSASTTYTVSWVDKLSSGTLTTGLVKYSSTNSTSGTLSSCTAVNMPVTGGWTNHTCTFTTGSGGGAPTSTNTLFIGNSVQSTNTMWIDSVVLATTAIDINGYSEGQISIGGNIITPLSLQNTTDSNSALTVVNAAGTGRVLAVDTINQITAASSSLTSPYSVFQVNALNATNVAGFFGSISLIDAPHVTTGAVNLIYVADLTSGFGTEILNASLTTGNLGYFNSSSSALSSGALVNATDNSATTATGGLIQISGTALTSGVGLSDIVGSTTGYGINVTANSLTTGAGLNISSTSSSLSTGGLVVLTDNSATTATGGILQINGTSLTSGVGININAGTGTSIVTNNGSTIDLGSATNGNTSIIKIPQDSGSTNCATGVAEGLIIKRTGGTQVGHICINGPTSGQANLLKFYAQAYSTGSTDVAENYTDVNNDLLPGDVVALSSTGSIYSIVKAVAGSSNPQLGIISTSPGVELTGISETDRSTNLVNPKPVALAGRVPTNVSTENGPISIGDFLTASSSPGVAMKAGPNSPYIGRALEAFNGAGVGQIEVFVQNGFNFTGNTSNTDLSVAGTLFANGGLRVAGPADFYGQSTFYKLATFIDKTVFNNDVTFNGRTTFNNDTAGFAVIHAGQTKVQVNFTKAYVNSPVVTVSSSDGQFNQYSYTNLNSQGFTIVIPKPATLDENFSWTALDIQNAQTFQVPTQ